MMRERLRPHIGHHVVCVCYGDPNNPSDICIECEDCGEVLVSAETFEFDEEESPRSCFGKYYDKHGNPCENGASGLCSYCVECQQEDINY